MPASSMSRTGATPAPSRRFEVGQWATPVPRRRELRDVGLREVDAMRAPDVVGQPAEPVEVLDRAAAVELDAVRLLLERLREVGVEGQPEPAGERGRLLHQPAGDRERRARRDRELHAGSRAGLVQQRCEALRLGEHGVELLDELVGRKAAVGLAEIHRAARGDDPHADLARRLHLGLDQPLAALREHVVMVEHGRAARQRELGEARARRRVLRLGVDPRPHRVQLAQPGEEVGLLRPGAREGLVQVVVGVDQARRDDGAVQVDALLRVRLGAAADRRDRRSRRRAASRSRARCRRRPSSR